MAELAPIFDCRTCGACCWSGADGQILPLDLSGYVALTAEDLARLPQEYRGRTVVSMQGLEAGQIAVRLAVVDSDRGPVCCAHVGALGEASRCAIYEDRPQACRDVKPGDRHCRGHRRLKGMA